ncbi:MAG TPA: hypothetical protein VFO35_22700 [Steroidobacteraceae bacterium]|nr:hypothetical protein [Steroidobacteraceae bacterium]
MIRTPVTSVDATPSAVQSSEMAAADERSLMAELSIVRGGLHYFYDGYRYDRLSDAVAYAQLVRGQPARHPSPASLMRFEAVEPLTESDRELMAELSITFENGRFVFGDFQYDRLIDAASYARLRRASAAT